MLVTPARCTILLKSQLPYGRGSRLFVALVVLGGFGIIQHRAGLYSHQSAPIAQIVVTNE
jgi:hypothetical protein